MTGARRSQPAAVNLCVEVVRLGFEVVNLDLEWHDLRVRAGRGPAEVVYDDLQVGELCREPGHGAQLAGGCLDRRNQAAAGEQPQVGPDLPIVEQIPIG